MCCCCAKAGLLCLELCGKHGAEENLRAGEWILTNYRDLPRAEFEYYGNYYNAQGMFQLGGKYWRNYCDWMYPHYLEEQAADGSWRDSRFGKIYGRRGDDPGGCDRRSRRRFWRLSASQVRALPDGQGLSVAPVRCDG